MGNLFNLRSSATPFTVSSPQGTIACAAQTLEIFEPALLQAVSFSSPFFSDVALCSRAFLCCFCFFSVCANFLCSRKRTTCSF